MRCQAGVQGYVSVSAPISFPRHWSLGKVQASWKSMLPFALHFNAGTFKGPHFPPLKVQNRPNTFAQKIAISINIPLLPEYQTPFTLPRCFHTKLCSGCWKMQEKVQEWGPKDWGFTKLTAQCQVLNETHGRWLRACNVANAMRLFWSSSANKLKG